MKCLRYIHEGSAKLDSFHKICKQSMVGWTRKYKVIVVVLKHCIAVIKSPRMYIWSCAALLLSYCIIMNSTWMHNRNVHHLKVKLNFFTFMSFNRTVHAFSVHDDKLDLYNSDIYRNCPYPDSGECWCLLYKCAPWFHQNYTFTTNSQNQ